MIQKKDEELEAKKKENEEQIRLINENYEKDVKNYESVCKLFIFIIKAKKKILIQLWRLLLITLKLIFIKIKISEKIKTELTENNIKYQNTLHDNKEKKEKEINVSYK